MFNKRTKIKQLLEGDQANFETTVMGWVRTFRNNQLIALNDGSTNNNLQIVITLRHSFKGSHIVIRMSI